MNKKGYSLVELLTVFILLGIVAGIVYSLTDNIKKDAKLETLKTSAKKLFVIVENYDAQNDYKNFPIEGLRIDQLDIEATNFTDGKVKVNLDGEYELVNITDGAYCINGVLEDLKIEKGVCPEQAILPIDDAVAAYIYIQGIPNLEALPSTYSNPNAIVLYVNEDNYIISIGSAYATSSINEEDSLNFYNQRVVALAAVVENPSDAVHYYIDRRDKFSYVAEEACRIDGINYCNGDRRVSEFLDITELNLNNYKVVQIVF